LILTILVLAIKKIRIADGSYSSIVGKSLVNLSQNISLKNVLHVPKLTCNLLSVSKFYKDSNYRVTFVESYCVFQELKSKKMIGSAKLINGLYYFEDQDSKNKEAQGLSSCMSNPAKDTVMLWHYRLGHPSFPYLKKLFPNLFKGLDCSKLYCENCILSKSHKIVYHPNFIKLQNHFT
jgi:hypothetical protein